MTKPENFIRSDCRQYLFGYSDEWDNRLPTIGFVMLTPSEPGVQMIHRCITKAHQLNGGGISIVYLLPQLNPNDREFDHDHVDRLLVAQLEVCLPVIACWGNEGAHSDRVAWYLDQVKEAGYTMTLHTLGFDKAGHPLEVGPKTHKAVPKLWSL